VLFCAHHESSGCTETLSFSEFRGDIDQRLTGEVQSPYSDADKSLARPGRKEAKATDVYGITHFLYHCFKYVGTRQTQPAALREM
jgi:hypothetical protein